MVKHHIELRRKSAMFGDQVFGIGFDTKLSQWVGGNRNGSGPTFQDPSLPNLLARIGAVLEADAHVEPV
jgi:hypothetical protein